MNSLTKILTERPLLLKISNFENINTSSVSVSRADPIILEQSEKKRERVRDWLRKNNYNSLIICRRENFSWLTTGADPSVVNTTAKAVGALVITRKKQFLISHTMDGRRLLDEQIPAQGYELIETRWFAGDPAAIAKNIAGNRVAADIPLQGTHNVSSKIINLHYPMTEFELDRIRWLGRAVHTVYMRMSKIIRSGMAENEIASEFLCQQAKMDITSDVMIVGSDERIVNYRHPMPTGKKVEKIVMLHSAARRWGLHAPVTRLFSFGEPDAFFQNAFNAVSYVQAGTFHLIKPGVSYANILNMQKEWYAEVGFNNEWMNHFQGGPTGYIIVNATNCFSSVLVKKNTPFEWFITVPGAKVAELTLLGKDGFEVVSNCGNWPQKKVQFDGREYQTPGIMVL